MKTRKALVKRFKITKSGKVLRMASGQNHYLAKKTGKRIRQRRSLILVTGALAKKIKKQVGKI
jgi:large subunit ribosomal protein L35